MLVGSRGAAALLRTVTAVHAHHLPHGLAVTDELAHVQPRPTPLKWHALGLQGVEGVPVEVDVEAPLQGVEGDLLLAVGGFDRPGCDQVPRPSHRSHFSRTCPR